MLAPPRRDAGPGRAGVGSPGGSSGDLRRTSPGVVAPRPGAGPAIWLIFQWRKPRRGGGGRGATGGWRGCLPGARLT